MISLAWSEIDSALGLVLPSSAGPDLDRGTVRTDSINSWMKRLMDKWRGSRENALSARGWDGAGGVFLEVDADEDEG